MTTTTVKNNKPTHAQNTTSSYGGYVPLGMSDGKCVILSNITKNVVYLPPSSMKEMDLKVVCGVDWCDINYTTKPKKNSPSVFDTRALANEIIRDCQRKGPYTSLMQRRRGVWAQDDGSLLINGGQLWKADGEVLEHGLIGDTVYTASGETSFTPATPEASSADVHTIMEMLNSYTFSNGLGAELLLGWFVAAALGPALHRRPHVLLTGPRGAGKSVIIDTLTQMMGPMAYACAGPQSMAAWYQALSQASYGVLLDEFEYDSKRRHHVDTLEISRISYSLGEANKGITRGTSAGTPVNYQFMSSFLAAGINPGTLDAADASRWVELELLSRKPEALKVDEATAREIGPRIIRLAISRWSNFKATEAVIHKAIVAAGGTDRMADTYGILLSAYWTVVSDTPATDMDAQILCEALDLDAQIENHVVSDEHRCQEALMSRVTSFRCMDDDYPTSHSLSIGEAVKRVCDDPTGSLEIVERLAQLGLRVHRDRATGCWQLMVVNSPAHQELRKIFAQTKWSSGWSTVLRRLPGGRESTQRIGAGFGTAKVTVFNLPADFQPAANDDFQEELRLAA